LQIIQPVQLPHQIAFNICDFPFVSVVSAHWKHVLWWQRIVGCDQQSSLGLFRFSKARSRGNRTKRNYM